MSRIIKASLALLNVNVSLRSPFMQQKHDRANLVEQQAKFTKTEEGEEKEGEEEEEEGN